MDNLEETKKFDSFGNEIVENNGQKSYTQKDLKELEKKMKEMKKKKLKLQKK